MPQRLTEEQAKFAGNLVRDAQKVAGLTNAQIADKAGYVEKTVREVKKGQCLMHKTVGDVCGVFKIDLDEMLRRADLSEQYGGGNAPASLGGYSKGVYGHFAGNYKTIRPAYDDLSRLKTYRTVIEWDSSVPCLRFTETQRSDPYAQNGQIYIPPSSAFMYLMTISKGWIRTVLVSQLVSHSSVMRGLILSQFNISGAHYAPVCAPIIYVKEKPNEDMIAYGEIGAEDKHYKGYARLLWETISETYVKVAVPSAHHLGFAEDS